MTENENESPDQSTPPTSVVAAIHAVRKNIGGIGKNGQMRGPSGNYSYRSIEDIKNAIRRPMDRFGLVIMPTATVVERDEAITHNDGPDRVKVTNIVTIRVQWTVMCATADGSITLETSAQGQDRGDKAHSKARTYAEKALYSELFALCSDPDPDGEKLDSGVDANNAIAAGYIKQVHEQVDSIEKAAADDDIDRARELAKRFRGWTQYNPREKTLMGMAPGDDGTLQRVNVHAYAVAAYEAVVARVKQQTS